MDTLALKTFENLQLSIDNVLAKLKESLEESTLEPSIFTDMRHAMEQVVHVVGGNANVNEGCFKSISDLLNAGNDVFSQEERINISLEEAEKFAKILLKLAVVFAPASGDVNMLRTLFSSSISVLLNLVANRKFTECLKPVILGNSGEAKEFFQVFTNFSTKPVPDGIDVLNLLAEAIVIYHVVLPPVSVKLIETFEGDVHHWLSEVLFFCFYCDLHCSELYSQPGRDSMLDFLLQVALKGTGRSLVAIALHLLSEVALSHKGRDSLSQRSLLPIFEKFLQTEPIETFVNCEEVECVWDNARRTTQDMSLGFLDLEKMERIIEMSPLPDMNPPSSRFIYREKGRFFFSNHLQTTCILHSVYLSNTHSEQWNSTFCMKRSGCTATCCCMTNLLPQSNGTKHLTF